MEPACPPIAAPVRIGTEVEENVDHRAVLRECDNRRRIERKHRLVDSLAELFVCLEQRAHRGSVMPAEGVAHALFRRTSWFHTRFNVLFERRPIAEAVFAREDQLRIGKGDLLLVRQHFPNTCSCLGIAGIEGLKQLFCLLFLLGEIRSRRERTGER